MKMLDLLNELMIQQRDLDMLNNYGETIIDEIETGPYHMILVKNRGGRYQIGLTSDENNFTTGTDQQKKTQPEGRSQLKMHFVQLVTKLEHWLLTHGKMTIGSFNVNRVKKYHSLLTRAGFNCGELHLGGMSGQFTIETP